MSTTFKNEGKDTVIINGQCVPPGSEVKVGGALRYDGGKANMALLCPIALEGLAQVLTFGAKKYTAHNWQKGMLWSRVIGSLLRHLFALMRGEDVDPESGLPHVDHIQCNAMFLANYYRQHPDKDDRFKVSSNNQKGETKNGI